MSDPANLESVEFCPGCGGEVVGEIESVDDHEAAVQSLIDAGDWPPADPSSQSAMSDPG
jgi:hypothetical protein